MVISGQLYNLLGNYLLSRFQRIILNGKTSSWRPVVPQASILVPFLFLFYVDDLPNKSKSSAKMFADDTSLLTIVKDKNESANIFNNNQLLIIKWIYNWKMLSNLDPILIQNRLRKCYFQKKKKIQNHSTPNLNNIQVKRASHHKHLRVLLDEMLNFKQHLDTTVLKLTKRYICNKKTQTKFSTEILHDSLQSFFEATN